MKTLRFIGTTMLTFLILTACEMTTDESDLLDPTTGDRYEFGSKKMNGEKYVSVPFFSDFFTSHGAPPNFEACEGAINILVTQAGDGNAAHLGKMSTYMTFCLDITDNSYFGGEGKFFAANGDELWFTISGQVLPYEGNDYDAYFKDQFFFTGGTGKFEEASGEGWTNSFVINEPFITYHEWDGVLNLKK